MTLPRSPPTLHARHTPSACPPLLDLFTCLYLHLFLLARHLSCLERTVSPVIYYCTPRPHLTSRTCSPPPPVPLSRLPVLTPPRPLPTTRHPPTFTHLRYVTRHPHIVRPTVVRSRRRVVALTCTLCRPGLSGPPLFRKSIIIMKICSFLGNDVSLPDVA